MIFQLITVAFCKRRNFFKGKCCQTFRKLSHCGSSGGGRCIIKTWNVFKYTFMKCNYLWVSPFVKSDLAEKRLSLWHWICPTKSQWWSLYTGYIQKNDASFFVIWRKQANNTLISFTKYNCANVSHLYKRPHFQRFSGHQAKKRLERRKKWIIFPFSMPFLNCFQLNCHILIQIFSI